VVQWKIERRHMELGVIAYRRLYCKQHYKSVRKGRRQAELVVPVSYRRKTKVAQCQLKSSLDSSYTVT
jgi:hypothetical protein